MNNRPESEKGRTVYDAQEEEAWKVAWPGCADHAYYRDNGQPILNRAVIDSFTPDPAPPAKLMTGVDIKDKCLYIYHNTEIPARLAGCTFLKAFKDLIDEIKIKGVEGEPK